MLYLWNHETECQEMNKGRKQWANFCLGSCGILKHYCDVSTDPSLEIWDNQDYSQTPDTWPLNTEEQYLEEFCQTLNWKPKDSVHLKKALPPHTWHLNREARTTLAQRVCRVMEPSWRLFGHLEVTPYSGALCQVDPVIMLLTASFLQAFISSPEMSWTT